MTESSLTEPSPTEPRLTRPRLRPHVRFVRALVPPIALTGAVLGIASWLREPPPQVTVTPPSVVVAAAPPAHVHVPAPSVVVTPPPTPPAPAPPVDMPPRPRALAPTLDAACVILSDEPPARCEWDAGFPAIAKDGSLIAVRHVPDDGGRGYPGLFIQFIDPSTSRIVRSDVVLSPDEYDEDPEAQGKLLAKIYKRAAAIQRTLDAAGYRSLEPLGSHESMNDVHDDYEQANRERLATHAEFSDALVRIVDRDAATELGRLDFSAAGKTQDDEALCGGWGLRSISVSWDPATRFVVAQSSYMTGGCMCQDVDVVAVKQLRGATR